MAVSELWLARHGESVANIAATTAERGGVEVIPIDIRDADVPLSTTGEEQATALGTWVAEHRSALDLFWVSPYVRARQTLAIALGETGPPALVIVDERLRDRELGILDLLTSHGVARLHPEEAARRRHLGKYYHRPPGGESWADVALRLRSFLHDAADAPGRTALVVAHDAVVMLILALLLPLEESELLEFAASHTVLNASVTHLVRRDAGWELLEFSGVAHLQTEGAPVTVHPGSPDVEPE
ncbi:MAG: histidine phosphatase family protein [Microbacterium sp.]